MTRFFPVEPKREFPSLSVKHSCGVSDAGKTLVNHGEPKYYVIWHMIPSGAPEVGVFISKCRTLLGSKRCRWSSSNLGVGYWLPAPKYTRMHILVTHAWLRGISTLRRSFFSGTLAPLEKSNLAVYPIDRHREGVYQWNFLIGCVRVGHRTMENQTRMWSNTWFHPVHRKWEFSAVSAEP